MLPSMNRRLFLQWGLAASWGAPLLAAVRGDQLDEAAAVLSSSVARGQVAAAAMTVIHGDTTYSRHFGKASSAEAMFLLGSISKPICVTALMTLFDKGEFRLEDRVSKYLPQFSGEGRETVTIQQLLTHVSGLPDQLPENDTLRKNHAGLAEFVKHAQRTPLLFQPGERYQYSSMGILLATHVAKVITGTDIRKLVDQTVFQPLEMRHSAQGLGRFKLSDMVRAQTEFAAPESGAGDPTTKNWDWNSAYWRTLGAPWGTTHASAPDLGKFFSEFLYGRGAVLKPATAKLMIGNRNGPGITPRGLAFNVGAAAGVPGCSEQTFGHTGSTGTIAWADPATETICIVLTSLPGRAVTPHPRTLVSNRVAAAIK